MQTHPIVNFPGANISYSGSIITTLVSYINEFDTNTASNAYIVDETVEREITTIVESTRMTWPMFEPSITASSRRLM